MEVNLTQSQAFGDIMQIGFNELIRNKRFKMEMTRGHQRREFTENIQLPTSQCVLGS